MTLNKKNSFKATLNGLTLRENYFLSEGGLLKILMPK